MQGHSVSLRFRSTEQCTFDREETRELESRTKHVQEKTSIFGDIFSGTAQKTTVMHKVLRSVCALGLLDPLHARRWLTPHCPPPSRMSNRIAQSACTIAATCSGR